MDEGSYESLLGQINATHRIAFISVIKKSEAEADTERNWTGKKKLFNEDQKCPNRKYDKSSSLEME